MFGEEDADKILEQHREQVLLEKKATSVVTFSTGQETGKTLRPVVPQMPDQPFVYKEPVLQFNGPVPPTTEVRLPFRQISCPFFVL